MSISDYVVDFNLELKKIESHAMNLPTGVLAYTPEQTSLCRATCANLCYKDMKEQIERISVSSSLTSKPSSSVHVEYMADVPGGFRAYEEYDQHHEQPYYDCRSGDFDYQSEVVDDTYFGRSAHPHYLRGRGIPVHNMSAKNRLDKFGNPTHCRYCKSICHWIDKCPHAPKSVRNAAVYHGSRGGRSRGRGRGSSTTLGESSTQFRFWHKNESESDDNTIIDVVLLAGDDDEQNRLFGETIDSAVVDTGCSKIVCGDQWLTLCLDNFPRMNANPYILNLLSVTLDLELGRCIIVTK